MPDSNTTTTTTNAGGTVTEEQLDDRIMKIVNGVISSHNKMADKKREQDKVEFKKMLDESLAAFKPATPPPTDDGSGGNKGKKDVEIETLKKRLEEVSRQAESTDRARAEERAKNRANMLRQKVTDALAVHGIEGVKAKAALALFKDQNRVAMSDDSEDVTFRADDGNDVDLNVGLQGWAKSSDEARLFLPATGARGAGTRPGSNGLPAGMTKEDAVKQFWETLGNTVRSG